MARLSHLASRIERQEDRNVEDAHVATLLEEIRGQFKVFGESLHGTQDEVRKTQDEVRKTQQEVRDTRRELGEKIDGLQERVTHIDDRVTHIDDRVTRIEKTLNGALARRKRRKPNP